MKKNVVLFSLLGIALIGAILISISIGSVSIPLQDIINMLLQGEESKYAAILRDIRIPRVIMAVLVGANLSVSGVLLQGVMRNPLADPGITGISSGASVTVMIMMLYFQGATLWTPVVGFIGGILACALIYSLAWNKGISAVRIILAGVAVNALLGGVSSLLSILNSDRLTGVLNWLNGELGKKSWLQVKVMLLFTIIGLVLALIVSKGCDILALGDKNARSIGFNPNALRLIISAVAVLLAGVSTAYVGVIGFIGLVVPHIARIIIGIEHKKLVPFSALLGGLILLLADTVGRTITAPYEIPVGIVTTVIGGPFFLYLLRKENKSYGY